MPDADHSLSLNAEHVARGVQASEGPQCARDEKAMKTEELKNREMMKLYRKEVLKEQQPVDLVQIAPAAPKPAPKQEEDRELVGTSGD